MEIIEKNVKCPTLENMLAEYQKPIMIYDDTLGELILNKRFKHFEGTVCWQNENVGILLDVNKDNKSTWTKARKAMKTMLSEQSKWDRELRAFAAKELTELACQWRTSADDSTPEITEQSFVDRIVFRTISMSAGGSFVVYFDDNDMFFNHCITVCGSLKKGVISADMEG